MLRADTPGTGGVGPREKRAEREDSIVQSQYLTPDLREAKIFATLVELSPLIAAGQSGTVRMILFGSCAVGEDTFESDIDLYIETTDRPATKKLISHGESFVSRKISPIIVSPDEAVQSADVTARCSSGYTVGNPGSGYEIPFR